MPKATCVATSNIAFVKYWGRIDDQLRLPMNGSISMNLHASTTTTTVEFDTASEADSVELLGQTLNDQQTTRVIRHVDRVRAIGEFETRVRVVSTNNFPMGAGIASSASAFAALTVASVNAAGLKMADRDLTILARQGSGSACRSVPGGFVEWYYGETSAASYAEQIAPPTYWDIHDLIAITQTSHKTVGSAEGNRLVTTSPFNDTRVNLAQQGVHIIRKAILDKDWTTFGEETEREAIRLHLVAMSSRPPIYYWQPATMAVIQAVTQWRQDGLEVYFTIDAGANVHIMAQAEDAAAVEERLRMVDGVADVIHNKPGNGSQLIEEHLF